MSKQKHIKFPLPKWNWWQVTLFSIGIIAALRFDSEVILKLLSLFKGD